MLACKGERERDCFQTNSKLIYFLLDDLYLDSDERERENSDRDNEYYKYKYKYIYITKNKRTELSE